jgi:hypothetical protein
MPESVKTFEQIERDIRAFVSGGNQAELRGKMLNYVRALSDAEVLVARDCLAKLRSEKVFKAKV